MNLSLPLRADQVKRRYRELAMQWHPDHNDGNVQAHARMTALNSAAELLTGVDLGTVPRSSQTTIVSDSEPPSWDVDGFKVRLSVNFGELFASDWTYAASFAARSNSVYLASYSGRVVVVDENGEGLRVYDIGNVRQRIVDTGEYVYILTATRLYVLRAESLHALIDTLDRGNLVIAKSGFGLLEKKRLRWFNKEGGLLGSILSRIRSAESIALLKAWSWRPASVGPPSAAHRPGGNESESSLWRYRLATAKPVSRWVFPVPLSPIKMTGSALANIAAFGELVNLLRRDLGTLREVELLQGLHPGQMRLAYAPLHQPLFAVLEFRLQQGFQEAEVRAPLPRGLLRGWRTAPRRSADVTACTVAGWWPLPRPRSAKRASKRRLALSAPDFAPQWNHNPIRQLWVMHPQGPLRRHQSIVYYRAAGPSHLDDFGRRCHFRAAYGIHIILGPRFALHRASTRHLWPRTSLFGSSQV